MRMQSFSALLTTFITVRSLLDFEYQQPSGGEEGECELSGIISTGNFACEKQSIVRSDFKQNADLTWKILSSACPDLVMAGCADASWSIGDHDMTELEWRTDCRYCPRCPCNSGASYTYYIKNYTQFEDPFEVRECYACACDTFYTSNGNTVYGRQCNKELTFDTPDLLRDTQCPYKTPSPTPPPTGGCDDNAGNEYVPGQFLFYYDSDQCETYCLCNDNNELECETGWDNIYANDNLRYDFLDTCGILEYGDWNIHDAQLADAWGDTSRWNTIGTTCSEQFFGPGTEHVYNRCPSVDCGSHEDQSEWSTLKWNTGVYDDNGAFDHALYDCVHCTCFTDIPQCSIYDSGKRSASDCAEDLLLCAEGDEDGVDGRNCSAADGDAYCGWKHSQIVDGFDPDTVCIEDHDALQSDEEWGCFRDYMCDTLFGYDALQSSESICSNQEVSWKAYSYDCINYKWLEETYETNVKYMCCKDASCNNQSSTALGESNCASNNNVDTYFTLEFECAVGDRGLTDANLLKYLHCDKDLPDGQYTVCDLLQPYWDYETRCDCREIQFVTGIWPDDDHHDNLEYELLLQFDKTWAQEKADLEIWNEAYDCGISFECSEDGVDALKMPLIPMLFVFVVYHWL